MPERKRGLQRVKMAAAAAAAAATEQVCEPAEAEGLGSGMASRPHGGRGRGPEGRAGAARRGGRAGRGGAGRRELSAAKMLAKAVREPGQQLRAGEGSCPSAGVTVTGLRSLRLDVFLRTLQPCG